MRPAPSQSPLGAVAPGNCRWLVYALGRPHKVIADSRGAVPIYAALAGRSHANAPAATCVWQARSGQQCFAS